MNDLKVIKAGLGNRQSGGLGGLLESSLTIKSYGNSPRGYLVERNQKIHSGEDGNGSSKFASIGRLVRWITSSEISPSNKGRGVNIGISRRDNES